MELLQFMFYVFLTNVVLVCGAYFAYLLYVSFREKYARFCDLSRKTVAVIDKLDIIVNSPHRLRIDGNLFGLLRSGFNLFNRPAQHEIDFRRPIHTHVCPMRSSLEGELVNRMKDGRIPLNNDFVQRHDNYYQSKSFFDRLTDVVKQYRTYILAYFGAIAGYYGAKYVKSLANKPQIAFNHPTDRMYKHAPARGFDQNITNPFELRDPFAVNRVPVMNQIFDPNRIFEPNRVEFSRNIPVYDTAYEKGVQPAYNWNWEEQLGNNQANVHPTVEISPQVHREIKPDVPEQVPPVSNSGLLFNIFTKSIFNEDTLKQCIPVVKACYEKVMHDFVENCIKPEYKQREIYIENHNMTPQELLTALRTDKVSNQENEQFKQINQHTNQESSDNSHSHSSSKSDGDLEERFKSYDHDAFVKPNPISVHQVHLPDQDKNNHPNFRNLSDPTELNKLFSGLFPGMNLDITFAKQPEVQESDSQQNESELDELDEVVESNESVNLDTELNEESLQPNYVSDEFPENMLVGC